MNTFVLLTVFFAVTHAASFGTDERLRLLLTYGADCANKTGVSVLALLQQSPSNNDPAYEEYITCFFEKYFSENSIASDTEKNVVGSIQNLPLIASYSKECAIQSKISLIALVKIADQNPPEDDPDYKKYILCYLLKLGILTEGGDISEDVSQVEKWLSPQIAKNVLDLARTGCGDQKGETLEDTAVLLFRCFLK